jgi:hypothetical protein
MVVPYFLLSLLKVSPAPPSPKRLDDKVGVLKGHSIEESGPASASPTSSSLLQLIHTATPMRLVHNSVEAPAGTNDGEIENEVCVCGVCTLLFWICVYSTDGLLVMRIII